MGRLFKTFLFFIFKLFVSLFHSLSNCFAPRFCHLREAAKKVIFLVARAQRGGGGGGRA